MSVDAAELGLKDGSDILHNSDQQILRNIDEEYLSLIRSGTRFSLRNLCKNYMQYSSDHVCSEYKLEASRQASQFLKQFGIVPDFTETVSDMPAFIYPTTISASRLGIVTSLMCLEFYIDDYASVREKNKSLLRSTAENVQAYTKECVRHYNGNGFQPMSSNYIYTVTDEILSQINCHSPPSTWVGRLKNHLHETRDDTVQEYKITTMAEYDRYRITDVGMKANLDLLEFCNADYINYDTLSEESLNLLADVHYVVAKIAYLSNDLISHYKEMIEHRCTFNALAITMQESNIRFSDAIRFIGHKIDESLNTFLYLLDKIKTTGSCSITYATGLENLLKGALRWQCQTKRYKSTSSVITTC